MLHPVNRQLLVLLMSLGMFTLPLVAHAEADVVEAPAADAVKLDTLSTLNTLIHLQAELKADIKLLGKQLVAAETMSEKKDLQEQLDKLEVDLQTTTRNLKEIAAGADIASLRAAEETTFNLQEELFSLLRPALKEMRDMTSHVRQKSDLKDKIAYYREKLPVAEIAVANLTSLLNQKQV